MRMMIATGGTGGHVMPAIAVAQQVLRLAPATEVLFVGSSRGLEGDMIRSRGFAFVGIPGVKLVGSGMAAKVKAPFVLAAAAIKALWLLLTRRPQVVLGAGGYASGAVVLLASLLHIPTAIMEQNARAGRTNRILSRFARRAYLSFQGSTADLKRCACLLVGNPMRKDLLEAAVTAPQDHEHLTMLVIGGSQGARPLNQAVIAALPAIRERFPGLAIIHQAGRLDVAEVKDAYARAGMDNTQVRDFFNDMAQVYAKSTFAFSRAGAGVLFELALFGVPSIVVPLPHAADNHQHLNAEDFAAHGCGVLMPQTRLDGDSLVEAMAAMLKDESVRRDMARNARQWARPQAAQDVARDLCSLAGAKAAATNNETKER